MKGYLLTRTASDDLSGIENYTEARWGEDQADRYMTALTSHFEGLVGTPEAGLLRSSRIPPFRMTREQSHYIIYDIHNDWIVVVAVSHTRQDVEGMAAHLSAGYRRDLDELKARFPALRDDGTIGED